MSAAKVCRLTLLLAVSALIQLPLACGASRLLRRSSGYGGLTSVAVEGSAALLPPRVYFLFLAVDKVSNLEVWQAFFAQAPADRYRALVHCKLPECTASLAGSQLVAVPTVPSYYCTDLVSPMNQLLAVALSADVGLANPADTFAFISDSTLPAKPFSHIYATLTAREGSDFCIFPSNEWADVTSAGGLGGGGLEMAPKHHQWVTLKRAHAEKASSLWASGTLHDFMTRFQMNTQAYLASNNTFADSRNFGCLDEFWHMAVLYGTMSQVDARQDKAMQLPLFTGGPLHISANAGWQGECDTFVIWSRYLHTPGRNPFGSLYSSLDSASVPHGGNSARPGWWDTISTTGLGAIRSSSFLFVRKFIDKPRLADGGSFVEAFSQIVLGA
mmetsp:Transcript_1396/g.3095  ORF Transcript_1396/g.3095 Transcript_1396/m.3095 type:complete len:386 (+) Transcript_1396:108-1265(+)